MSKRQSRDHESERRQKHTGTQRVVGRRTASAIAYASRKAVLRRGSGRHHHRRRSGTRREWELALKAGGSKGKEGLRLFVEVDGVVGPRPDIVAWLVNQRSKWNRGSAALSLEHYPSVLALILKPASPGDDIKQAFAGWLWYDGWVGEAVVAEFISPITIISELFWVTSAPPPAARSPCF
jgi:hypothetical protein